MAQFHVPVSTAMRPQNSNILKEILFVRRGERLRLRKMTRMKWNQDELTWGTYNNAKYS
jgi:hypothetical protein